MGVPDEAFAAAMRLRMACEDDVVAWPGVVAGMLDLGHDGIL